MKLYHLKRKQFLPISLDEAWTFFSSPRNLSKITPPNMGFDIIYLSGDDKMYCGQIISYRLTIFSIFKINWVTEITHVEPNTFFIDEQRFGPYAFWHHQHLFRSVEGGVEMIDELNYGLRFGYLGRLLNWIFVGSEVNTIFDFRFKILETYFKSQTNI